MNRQIDRIVLLISFSIIASLLLIACAWLILRRSQEAQPTENLDYKRQEWESKDIPYVPIVNHKTLNESFTEKDTNAFKRNVNMALLEKFPDDVFLFMDWVWILDRPIAAILICWKKLPECEMGIIKAPSKFPKTVQNNFCWKVGIDESQKEVIWSLLADYTLGDKSINAQEDDSRTIVAVVELTDGRISFGGKYLDYSEYKVLLMGLGAVAREYGNNSLLQAVEDVLGSIRRQSLLHVREHDK